MSLPNGYKRLEYIDSDGTQWINTEFKANENTRVVCDFQLLSETIGITSSYPHIYGCRRNASTDGFALRFIPTRSCFNAHFGNAKAECRASTA